QPVSVTHSALILYVLQQRHSIAYYRSILIGTVFRIPVYLYHRHPKFGTVVEEQVGYRRGMVKARPREWKRQRSVLRLWNRGGKPGRPGTMDRWCPA
ncbi:MAG: hypothetical protein V7459_14625, partial [Oceanicoccus sp.]